MTTTTKAASKQQEVVSSDNSVVDGLRSGAVIASIAAPIVAAHQNNGKTLEALAIVVNAVLRIAGAKGSVDEEILGTEDVPTTLEEVLARENIQTMSPLVAGKDPASRRLKKRLPQFFAHLIEVLLATEVEDALVDAIHTWFSALNESKARSFRYVASMAMFGCMDGFIAHITSTDAAITSSQKKHVAEKKARLAQLKKTSEAFFASSMHNRIKDVSSDIRLLALEKLSSWLSTHPQLYLDNIYLRYLRVGLNDKKAENRIEALEAVALILAQVPNGFEKLAAFLAVIMPRVVELCNDIDTKCAYVAVKVCMLLVKFDGIEGSETLSHESLDRVFCGLLDDRSIIRTTTGTLLKVFINSKAAEMEADHPKATLLIALVHSLATLTDGFAEELVVDALWGTGAAPPMLLEPAPFVELCKSTDLPNTLIGLRLVAAVLRRLGDSPAVVGTAPKDDLFMTTKGGIDDDEKKLRARAVEQFSKDMAPVLVSILQRFPQTEAAILAISDVIACAEVGAFTKPNATKLITAFEAQCKTTDMGLDQNLQLVGAWRSLAFSAHQHSSLGEEALQSFLKSTLSRIVEAKTPIKAAAQWSQMACLTSLVSLPDKWKVMAGALGKLPADAAELQWAVVLCCFNSVVWALSSAAASPDASLSDLPDRINTIISTALPLALSSTADSPPSTLKAHANILVACCDLMCLPMAPITDNHVGQAILSVKALLQFMAAGVHGLQETAKETLRVALSSAATEQSWYNHSSIKAASAASEALQGKVVASICRTFLLNRASPDMAPPLIALWPSTSFKSSSDNIKQLFHALRERSGSDGLAIEKNAMLSAIGDSDDLSPETMSSVYALGAKLASLHFTVTDKHYTACKGMVEFCIQHSTHDERILHGGVSYCGKLHRGDALTILRSLTWEDPSPLQAAFITQLQKTAKVAETSAPKVAAKRPRAEQEVDADLAGAMASSSPNTQARSDGWRGRKLEATTANVPDESGTMIATEEWE